MIAGEGSIVRRLPQHSTTDQLLAEAVGLAQLLRGCLQVDRQLAATCRPTPPRPVERTIKVAELTALLGLSVAWLSTRKAVAAGVLSPEEGRAPARRLATLQPVGRSLGMRPPAAGDWLGRQLATLEVRVHALHERLARLDRLLDEPG